MHKLFCETLRGQVRFYVRLACDPAVPIGPGRYALYRNDLPGTHGLEECRDSGHLDTR